MDTKPKYFLLVFFADKPKDELNYKSKKVDKDLFDELKNAETLELDEVIYKVVEKRITRNIIIIDVRHDKGPAESNI